MLLKKALLKKIIEIYTLCKRRRDEGHLSVPRQMAEILALRVTRGIGHDLYHYAGMWKKGTTWRHKRSFLGRSAYLKKVYQLNARKYHGISQYKPVEKAFFKQFNIPTPRYLGTLQARWGCTPDGDTLRDGRDLSRWAAARSGDKLCFKMVEGHGGNGFKAFAIDGRKGETVFVDLRDLRRLSADELVATLYRDSDEGWLLEDYIEQHSLLRAFNPSSVNTVRMLVYQDNSGRARQLASFLKTGRPGALIDKTENGGAAVLIDQRSGELLQGFDWSPAMRPLARNPGSDIEFKGVRLPFWHEAEQLALRAVQVCPGIRFAGVDIAFTADGPVLIEMNVQPDNDCHAVLNIPTATVFER